MLVRNISIAVFSCIIIAGLSCKKETEYAAFPFKDIQAFKIAAGEETINGALENDSIIIYWPSYLEMPASITPDITLSEKATIQPAAKEGVAFKTGTKYTVKAQDGSTKDYFLKVVINQPGIQIYEATYSAVRGGTLAVDNGRLIRYIIRDTAQTHFFLVDTAGRETRIAISFATRNNTPYTDLKLPGGDTLQPGAYRIKINSGIRTLTTENAIFGVLYAANEQPAANPVDGSITLKHGSQITFTGTGFIDMKEGRVFGYNTTTDWSEKEIATLQLLSFTATSATYRIPDNFPTGNYELNSYNDNGIFFQLRTTDFIGFWDWNKQKKVYVNIDGAAQITVTD